MTESQTIEFKQIWKDEYLKTICAFANTSGGNLYIGLDDDSKVIGIKDTKNILETLPNKINNKLGLIVNILLKNENEKKLSRSYCTKVLCTYII